MIYIFNQFFLYYCSIFVHFNHLIPQNTYISFNFFHILHIFSSKCTVFLFCINHFIQKRLTYKTHTSPYVFHTTVFLFYPFHSMNFIFYSLQCIVNGLGLLSCHFCNLKIICSIQISIQHLIFKRT